MFLLQLVVVITAFCIGGGLAQTDIENWDKDNSTNTDLECGKVDDGILSGYGSTIDVNIPWAAVVVARSELQSDAFFAAVIISPSLIMTSADHFVMDRTTRLQIMDFKQYFVSVGTRMFGDPTHVDYNAQRASITHITIQPGFIPGNWSVTLNEIALLHLAKPLTLSAKVRPICLPKGKEIDLVQQPGNSSGNDSVTISGWNTNIKESMFLRLSFQPQSTCRGLWDTNTESNHTAYVDRACAFVTKENKNITCIHKGIAVEREMEGRYYLAGTKNILYSTNETRQCHPGAHFYIWSYDAKAYGWIDKNMRCGPHNFTCGNGDCIGIEKICNQVQDCLEDGMDEEPLYCRGRNPCTEEEFGCGVYGKCIPKSKVNDGVEDCEKGEDEFLTDMMVWVYAGAGVGSVLILVFIILIRRYVMVLKNRIRNLTQQEIDDFKYGLRIPYSVNENENEKNQDGHMNRLGCNYINIANPIHEKPWNWDHEIPRKLFTLGDELDRGNFGVVHRGKFFRTGSSPYVNLRENKETVEVAIKTHLPTVGVEEFKALLCELKILAHVGVHQNIVSFLGACTEKIKTREVFMLIEYCPNKSIREHIRNNRENFLDIFQRENCSKSPSSGPELEYSNIYCMNTHDLLKWSFQIASGMEHLVLKNIVHGDLAARNVLLSSTMNAKISDFGLSRELGGSEVYVKTTQERVPWKWLAIESLQEMRFSEKSDVWAYGVTLWELFTLGETPFTGEAYNQQFIASLVSGLRLPSPPFASNELYLLMGKCWDESPESRPNFNQLKHLLSDMSRRCMLQVHNVNYNMNNDKI